MKKCLLPLLVLALGCDSPSTAPTQSPQTVATATPEMKEMPLDDFLNGILSVKIPIKIAIPASYAHAKLRNTPVFSSYWMTPSGAEKASRSDDLPLESGWIYGELSGGVAFNLATKKFIGIDVTSQELSRNGFKVLGTAYGTSNGFPIVFVEILHKPTNKPIYMMYVATLLEENVLVVSYRPPNNNRVIGDAVWAALKKSVSAV